MRLRQICLVAQQLLPAIGELQRVDHRTVPQC